MAITNSTESPKSKWQTRALRTATGRFAFRAVHVCMFGPNSKYRKKDNLPNKRVNC